MAPCPRASEYLLYLPRYEVVSQSGCGLGTTAALPPYLTYDELDPTPFFLISSPVLRSRASSSILHPFAAIAFSCATSDLACLLSVSLSIPFGAFHPRHLFRSQSKTSRSCCSSKLCNAKHKCSPLVNSTHAIAQSMSHKAIERPMF